MTSRVLGEMIAAHEMPTAERTPETLLARVSSPVTRQLVRTSELLVAILPLALIRFLPY